MEFNPEQLPPAANLIGERVRWVRERLQLTQDQLAGRWITSRLAR
jgi:DNA-binding transcriptional regulator YiaG